MTAALVRSAVSPASRARCRAVALLAGQLPPLVHRFGAVLTGGVARILFDVLVTSVPLPRTRPTPGGCPLREICPMAPSARGREELTELVNL
ncbi:hypothetical protein [Streptomyces sp. NPDC059994]|uniref:hypothetical protein n=1 Tax=Streptomyces sp. NPDC059994 TaxID=3347029 RepID=UPI0036BE3C90